MTDASKDSVGIFNYTIKRDFRRDLDKEVRSEGYDKFKPNTVPTALATQHLPAGVTGLDAIELIVEVLRANGQRALIVGTKTTLWKFEGSDNGCFLDPTYVDSTYFETINIGQWTIIGDGFSRNGRRWEAEQVGDYLVLNNAVDLLITYRLQDPKVVPLYELRENGVVSVGTIASHMGILMCADIQLIDDTTLKSIMSLKASGVNGSQAGVANGGAVRVHLNSGVAGVEGTTLTATSPVFMNTDVARPIRLASGLTAGILALGGPQPSVTAIINKVDLAEPDQPYYWPQVGNADFTVVSSGAFFTAAMVGLKLVWDTGEIREIVSFISSAAVVVDQDGPIANGPFKIENSAAYGAYTDTGKIDRFQYRVIWGMNDKPRRFASTVPCSVNAGDNFVRLDYPAKSLEIGMNISIPGASEDGGTLQANIVYVSAAHHLLAIDQFAATTVSSVLLEATDAIDSIVAFKDLVDDGSGILRMMSLRSTMVMYRDASIYLAAYTGDTTEPFVFDRPIPTEHSLWHRNTLVAVTPVQGGVPYHLYAGRSSFYKFDLITKSPVEVLELHLVKDVFFKDSNGPGYVLGDESLDWASVQAAINDPINNHATVVTSASAGSRFLVRNQDGTEYVWNYGLDPAIEILPAVSMRYIYGRREDRIFAAENALTREVFFVFPGTGSDRAIRFNYRDGTVSTTSIDITAAAMVRRPLNPGEQSQRYEDWFVLGTANGTLLRYGLLLVDSVSSGSIKATKSGAAVTVPIGFFEPRHVGRSIFFPASRKFYAITGWTSPASVTVVGAGDIAIAEAFTIVPTIYHRDGSEYESIMVSGLESFGSAFKEKQINGYVLLLSSAGREATIDVSFIAGANPSETAVVGSGSITKPNTQNLIPVCFRSNYLGDQIRVSGVNNPVEIVGRVLSIAGVEGSSFSRRSA